MKFGLALKLVVFSATVALADIVFKIYAIKRLPEGGRLSFPIDLALHKNPGIAFDIPIPLWIVVSITIAVTFFLVKLAKKNYKKNHGVWASAIIIVIGAFGNMFDRIINGFTTDYLILFGRSAINLSDILIIFGTLLLLYYNENKNMN